MASTWIQRALKDLILLDRGVVPGDSGAKKYIPAPLCLVSVDGQQFLSTDGNTSVEGGRTGAVAYNLGSDSMDEDWFLGGNQGFWNLSGRIIVKGGHEFGDWKGSPDTLFGLTQINLV